MLFLAVTFVSAAQNAVYFLKLASYGDALWSILRNVKTSMTHHLDSGFEYFPFCLPGKIIHFGQHIFQMG